MLTLAVVEAEHWSGAATRLGDLWRSAGPHALNLLIAVAAMLVGWGIAALASAILYRALRALRFNEGARRVVGTRTASRHEPAGVVAWAVYWVVIAVSALIALEALGLSLATSCADRLSEVIPRIVTSAVLFAAGYLIALLVGSVTRRFLESADIRTARLQGQVVGAVLTGFAALLALEQLGFAAHFVMALGVAAVAAAGLGLALAFGLGCRELARDFVIEYLRSLDDEKPKRPD